MQEVKKIYGARLLDKELRKASQSGGAFTAFAEMILKDKGIVYGVSLDDKNVAKYIRVTETNDLEKLKGSKYVQADVGNTFNSILSDLKDNKIVFFTGCPCCVKGLLLFLSAEKVNVDNLVTCDLVCHGVPSPKVFEKYINSISENNIEKVSNFKFRDKNKGWHSHFETYYIDGEKKCSNVYANLFSINACLRESCYNCKFTNVDRVGDLTIGDLWGLEKIYPELDDNSGMSLVFVSTSKGKNLFDKAKYNFEYFETDVNSVLQPQLVKPTAKPIIYNDFWDDVNSKSFKYIMFKYGKGGLKGIIKSFVKKLFKKLKIYNFTHSIWMYLKNNG